MNVLVAIASNHGSTGAIGERIAEVLREAEHTVEVHRVEDVRSLDRYDGVILGSAVYIGRVLTAATKFAARLEHEFAPRPVWAFISGMKNVTPYPLGAAFTTPRQAPYLSGRITTFAGFVDRAELGTAEKSLIGFVGANTTDQRDFDLIAAWAGEVAVRMHQLDAAKASPRT